MVKREDVIVDPTDPRAEGLKHKQVYFGDSFSQIQASKGILTGVAEHNFYAFELDDDNYRVMIAPIPELTYRPFKSTEEFAPYRDKWIAGKKDAKNFLKRVIDYGPQGVTVADSASKAVDVKFICYSWEDAFDEFYFEGDAPFGVKE